MSLHIICVATLPCDLSLNTLIWEYRLFSYIAFAQGSVATCIRCGGIFIIMTLLPIFFRESVNKKIENWLRFYEITAMSLVSHILV